MKRERALSLAVVLTASLAFAHGSGAHLRGVVENRDAAALVVRTARGKETVRYDAETRFLSDDRPVSAEEARVGRRVEVHAVEAVDGLKATEVKLGVDEPPKQRKAR